jgi:antitoxin CcdA
LKEEMQAYKVETSKVLRKALEDEVKRKRLEELKRDGEASEAIFAKISADAVSRGIREDRESR